jgi:hypothetical protein
MSRLYFPHKPLESAERDAIVYELDNELDKWETEVPAFFDPVARTEVAEEGPFHRIPWLFRRQQWIVRGSFWYTKMFLYRHYLLEDFLHKMPKNLEDGHRTIGSPPENVQKCIDAALRVAQTAAELRNDQMYNPVFWVRFAFPSLVGVLADFYLLLIDFVLFHILFYCGTARLFDPVRPSARS